MGDLSVFVRVPQSLERGELSLQRVAHRAGSDDSAGKSLRFLLCRGEHGARPLEFSLHDKFAAR